MTEKNLGRILSKMNIFVLDNDPKMAPQYYCDKHVVKMCLETAQILCSVRHNLKNTTHIPYKLTHKNHPCVIWAGKSKANYKWLTLLGISLCNEYTYRYNKVHKCLNVIYECDKIIDTIKFQKLGLTPFILAMPEEYKTEDPVKSYRLYYIMDKMEKIQCNWTKRPIPDWISYFV